MSLESMSVLKDGTVSTTGGTATTALLQNRDQAGVTLLIDDGSELLVQPKINFTARSPRESNGAPNGFTQRRAKAHLEFPVILDNGNRTINTIKLELAADVEMTDAEIESMLVYAAQVIADSDFSDFWKRGSLS